MVEIPFKTRKEFHIAKCQKKLSTFSSMKQTLKTEDLPDSIIPDFGKHKKDFNKLIE